MSEKVMGKLGLSVGTGWAGFGAGFAVGILVDYVACYAITGMEKPPAPVMGIPVDDLLLYVVGALLCLRSGTRHFGFGFFLAVFLQSNILTRWT